jgi:uncharacterized membrane protein
MSEYMYTPPIDSFRHSGTHSLILDLMQQQYRMLVSALGLVAIDFAYLSVIKGHFARQIAAVQGSPMVINLFGAVVTYVFLIFGLNYFIIRPGRSAQDAFLLGLVTYGVYDFTNLALLSKWQLFTAVTDTLWGGTLFYLTTRLVQKVVG